MYDGDLDLTAFIGTRMWWVLPKVGEGILDYQEAMDGDTLVAD